MANLENLAVFALPPSEALGRAVAEDYGLVIAPHELRQFEDGEHKIVDDLIVTGTTLVRAAEACRKRGAIAVHAMATHGVFTKATGGVLATPLIDSMVVTDTVSPERTDMGPSRAKLSIVSIAPLLARAIGALHHERSMTQMMED